MAFRDAHKKTTDEIWAEFWMPIFEHAESESADRGEPVQWAHAMTIPVFEQLKKELADYAMLLDNVPLVYGEISGGQISKPNTVASDVLDEYNKHVEEVINDSMVELIEYLREEDLESEFAAWTARDLADHLVQFFGIRMPEKEST